MNYIFNRNNIIAAASAFLLTVSSCAVSAEAIPDPFAQFKNNPTAAVPNASGVQNTASAPLVLPSPPTFDAESWVLMDYHSGQVLFEHNGQKKIWPASLTKMMTSYVIGMEIKAGRLKPDDQVMITEEAWSKNYSDSSKMFIEVGDTVSVDSLNKGIIIQSGNDACVAMAIHLAGSEAGFVSVMNTYAKQLGLNHTHFSNVHGLFSEDNYSTAYDMALLGRALIRDLPEEYSIYAQKEFTFNGIKQSNRNRLLWDKTLNVDGIKTGHLSQVGYNLVASAPSGNMRLIASVIGAKSESQRADFCRQMLSYGFRFFELYTPFKQGQSILKREVRLGDTDSVDLTVNEDVGMMIPRGSSSNIKISYRLNKAVFTAPIAKGDNLGIIEFKLNDKTLSRAPLVAKEAVNEGGFFSQLWDKAYMFFTSESNDSNDK